MADDQVDNQMDIKTPIEKQVILEGTKEDYGKKGDDHSEMSVDKINDGEECSESMGTANKEPKECGNEENDEEGTAKKLASGSQDMPRSVKRGLLDEPVLREGKRQRHAVERLAASSVPTKRSTLDAIGSGTSLGDIEFVNVGLSKAQSETLKLIHKLCYGTTGTAASRKRDLRKFNGYAFDETSSDFEKKKAMAMKLTTVEMNLIAKLLGSERGHTKEETVMSVLRFLQKPEDKGKKIQSSKKRRSSMKSSKKATKKRRIEKKGNKSKKEKESDESDDAGQSMEEDKEEMEEPHSVLKINMDKTKSSRKLHATDSKISKNETTWGDGGPSNEEVETTINDILRSVDLVNCTMKQMCERIAEKFPNLDMATYKTSLKERVKIALERMEDT